MAVSRSDTGPEWSAPHSGRPQAGGDQFDCSLLEPVVLEGALHLVGPGRVPPSVVRCSAIALNATHFVPGLLPVCPDAVAAEGGERLLNRPLPGGVGKLTGGNVDHREVPDYPVLEPPLDDRLANRVLNPTNRVALSDGPGSAERTAQTFCV